MPSQTAEQNRLRLPRLALCALLLAGVSAALALGLAVLPAAAAPNAPLTIIVNSAADVPDATPGNTVCETALGNNTCTLRGAIQEAGAHPGPDVIILQANTTYLLARADVVDTSLSGDLDITDTLTILGAGPDSTIIDGNGGALHERVMTITGTIVISGVTIQHGFSPNIAGGLYNTGHLTLINTAILSNTANGLNDWGGGIFNAGPMTLTHSLVRGNTTGSHNPYGGGMYNQGLLLIQDSTFSDNQTPSQGGGLFSIGYTTTVKNSTFSGNTADQGGGIYKGGYPLTLINSTIAGNFSNFDGGGLYANFGTTSLFNVTVAGNMANADGSAGGGTGAGIFNGASSTVYFLNSLLSDNVRLVDQGQFDLALADECAGTLLSQGYNIVRAYDSSHCTVAGPFVQADPQLRPLQDNGGPTQTEALTPGSPAIDAGNPSGCTDYLGAPVTTDQRGRPRPTPGSNHCDIGAFEFSALLYLPLATR